MFPISAHYMQQRGRVSGYSALLHSWNWAQMLLPAKGDSSHLGLDVYKTLWRDTWW